MANIAELITQIETFLEDADRFELADDSVVDIWPATRALDELKLVLAAQAQEIERLRDALEACRQHVRHHNNSGSWWNDPIVWKLMREKIDPALGIETRE
jgi:hypothetical protein